MAVANWSAPAPEDWKSIASGGAAAAIDGDRGDLRQARTSLPEPATRYIVSVAGFGGDGPDQVWCLDITYVPMATGFMYLVAVMDWWSRYVLGGG